MKSNGVAVMCLSNFRGMWFLLRCDIIYDNNGWIVNLFLLPHTQTRRMSSVPAIMFTRLRLPAIQSHDNATFALI